MEYIDDFLDPIIIKINSVTKKQTLNRDQNRKKSKETAHPQAYIIHAFLESVGPMTQVLSFSSDHA